MGAVVKGVVLITIGSILVAAGLVIGLVFQLYIREHVFDGFLVYKRDDKFDDPTYMDCKNESFNAFMFNMTNSAAVLAGTEKPNYVQKGPYNFTREVCIYNVSNNEKYEYFKKIWKPYYLLPSSEVSESDRFVNWNLGYLSVIKTIEKTLPSAPETGLALNFLGNILGAVFQQLTGAKFVDQAKVLGVAQVLAGIRDLVLPQAIPAVKAGGAVAFLNGAFLANAFTSEDFFNTVGTQYGIATLANETQTFSNESQRLIFFGSTTGGDPLNGLLADRTGRTLLGFLSTLQYVASTGNISALTPFAVGFQVTPTQLSVLGNWARVVLYGQLWVPIFQTEANVNLTALNTFYNQWANGTGLDPRGLNLIGDSQPDGFELLGPNTPSNISLAVVTQIWNATNPLSILNLNGIVQWFTALQLAATGNTTLLGPFIFGLGLTPTQVSFIGNYLRGWQNSTVEPFIMQQYGVTSLFDLAWLQWGTGILPNGASVSNFDSTIPSPPEFSVFAASRGITTRFNITFSKRLINGPPGFLGTNGTAPQFFGLMSTGNLAAVQALYGLGPSEASAFFGYLNYFLVNFVDAFLVRQIFAAGGGPITSRTARQILFDGTDPLVNLIRPNASIGAFFDSDTNYQTKQEADTVEPLQNRTIYYKKGTLDDLEEFLQIREYKGSPYIAGYNNVTVMGNKDGKNWVPNSLKKDKDVVVWYDLVRQPTPWTYRDEIEVKGIKLWAYRLAPGIWLPEDRNPDRRFYEQKYEGLVNITGIKSVRTFLSRPHFQGVDPVVANTVTGLDPNNPYYDDTYFGTHQASGITMIQSLKAQLSVGFPALTRYYNISAGYGAIMWRDDYVVIEDDDADKFKGALAKLAAAVIIPFVVGIGLGLIFVAVGVVFVVRGRQSGDSDEPKKSMKMQTLEINDEGVETKNNVSDSD